MHNRQHARQTHETTFRGHPQNGSSAPGTTSVDPQWPPGHQWSDSAGHEHLFPDTASWSLPFPSTGQTPNLSFSYPNTPGPFPTSAPNLAYVAPPHQQPMSEVHDLHPAELASTSNLGFATLDDWFGQSDLNHSGDNTNGAFGGLDLQDFWFQVGPGEVRPAQASFALLTSHRRRGGFHLDDRVMHLGFSWAAPQRSLCLRVHCYFPPAPPAQNPNSFPCLIPNLKHSWARQKRPVRLAA